MGLGLRVYGFRIYGLMGLGDYAIVDKISLYTCMMAV